MKKSNKVLFIALGSFLAIMLALLLYFAVTLKGTVDERAGRTAQYHGACRYITSVA